MTDGSPCVVFDLDGTLIESEQVWRDVRHEYVNAHGGRWHDNAQSTMIGMRTQEWARYMHDELNVNLAPAAIAKQVVEAVTARLKDVPILPGANEALERIARDFRLGLATSAALPVANSVLSKTGWNELFAVVVSADEVSRGKPAPDVYRRAVELLHAEPSRTAAVEDSENGIRSAYYAGLAVVAIPNHAFPPGAASLALASHVLANLNQLDAAAVYDALRGRSGGI
ncbi:MAG: HAD family phosphatase [Candidatus Cybelea sp.]